MLRFMQIFCHHIIVDGNMVMKRKQCNCWMDLHKKAPTLLVNIYANISSMQYQKKEIVSYIFKSISRGTTKITRRAFFGLNMGPTTAAKEREKARK